MSSSSSSSESSSSISETSSSSDQKKQDAIRYRFSGYQLPKLQLDETGPSYYVMEPHPYFRNQPEYWQKPAYKGITLGTTEVVGGHINIQKAENTENTNYSIPGGGTFDLMDF